MSALALHLVVAPCREAAIIACGAAALR